MADVQVNFMHPTDGRLLTVTLDDTYLGREVVNELIASDFVPPSDQGYLLSVKGGHEINADQNLHDAGIKGGETIRVLAATDAGMIGGS